MFSFRALLLVVLILVVTLNIAGFAQSPLNVGGFSFAAPTVYSSGGYWPSGLAVSDLNGDGKPDLLVLNGCTSNPGCTSSVVVRLGSGDGTFGPAITYPTLASTSTALAVADVNGDGKSDLLVTNACVAGDCLGLGSVSVLLGNGDGTFQAASLFETGGTNPSSIAVADVNGDGKLDLLVFGLCANGCPGNGAAEIVSVMLGNGDGSFQPATNYVATGAGPADLVVADVNADGKPDLVVSSCALQNSCGVGGVAVLLGNGDGTFQPSVGYASGGGGAGHLSVSDVNGDGKPDLVVVNSSSTNFKDSSTTLVGVLINNGDGTFQSAVTYAVGGYTGGVVAVKDVNGDSLPDLLIGVPCQSSQNGGSDCIDSTSSSFVSVLLSNGSGNFRTPVLFDSGGYGPKALAAADVNGDGRPDLVIVNQCDISLQDCAEGSVAVLLNTSTSTGLGTTTTALISSANPSSYAQPVTFTATLTPQGWGLPTGSVGFEVDGSFLAYAPVSGNGVATLTTPTLAVGTRSITATYYGDQNFGPSSAGLQQVVQGGVATLSTTTLDFGTQPYGSTSNPLSVTLSNTGNSPLNLSSIGISGTSSGFVQSNHCPAAIATNGSCTITVTFTPASHGTSGATLSINSDGIAGPQAVQLLGTTDFVLTPQNVSFPSEYVGEPGSPQTVTVTNTGTTTVPIANLSVGPSDFDTVNGCGSSVAAGASCNITVGFHPTATGDRSGTLSIANTTAQAVPQTVPLSGTGQDFSFAAAGSSTVTVSAGSPANYSVNVAPAGGFSGVVTFTCSGAPTGSTCAVSPASITLNGSVTDSVVVTVTTMGPSAALAQPAKLRLAGWLALAGLPGLVLLGGSHSRRQRLLKQLMLLGMLAVLIGGSACGGGSTTPTAPHGGGGTPSGSYPINVTASFTSGSISLVHTTKLTLVVN